ncbi:MAG: DUF2793 domain-containing protein [Pseudomonadota bacterium]
MPETANLNLPLVEPAQAQKHVTVNEAFARIDAALQLSVLSRSENTPPALNVEGDMYLVALGGVNAWSGQDGKLAVFVNGGWDFMVPQTGWKIWAIDESAALTFDGASWRGGVQAMSASKAAMRAEVVEIDHVVIGGSATETTTFVIPANTSVFAVTGLVLAEITGSLTSWSLGADGSTNRYGSGLGLAQGSFVQGLTGQPLSYYTAAPLTLTADAGSFASGSVRLAVHLMRFDLPEV